MIVETSYIPVIEDYNKDGTLKLSAILKILENAGNCHSDSVGDNVLTGSNNGKAWVLTDWKLEIISYPVYGNDIKTQTWGEDGKSPFCLMRDFLLYADGQLCVKGTTQWVLFDLNTGKICRVEADLVNKYEPESKKVFDDIKLSKINIPQEFSITKEITLRRCDIDFNDHVHNISYLDFAMEALPENIYKNSHFKHLRITYKNAVTSGEKVIAKYSENDGKHIVCIYGDDNTLSTLVEFVQ